MEETVLKPMSLTARFNPCEIPKSKLAYFPKTSGDGQWAPEGNVTGGCRLADLFLWNGDW